uniref:Glycosyltransferase family 92 protein n=1 Tax=Rhabditophanes sp. KR3021 TaxID=114890 RepID=A0AC35TP88_9BILA
MVAISKFNNRYRNLQNKLAILLIISCCLTSIAFLVNKIDRANKSDGNDLDDDDVLGEKDLFLVSSVLKNPSTQQDKDLLFLSFISKKNNLSAALKCVSIDDKGNKWITDLINTNVDQISEKKFIILSNCLITKNTKHIFLRESKRMIHLNNIVFEDDITNNQTKNRTTVCLNPLFMFGDKLILKGMLDYYKSDVDQIYTYSISYSSELESMLKLSNDLNLLVPWFFNSQRVEI